MRRVVVERGRYFDSVFLLRISRSLEELPGILHATVVMGTPANLENLARVGFVVEETIRPDDLVIGVEARDARAAEVAQQTLAVLLVGDRVAAETSEDLPATLDDAVSTDVAANLALVSVPGAYAAAEARRALRRGLHVMLFSDNVAIEDEVALKDEAARRGLLVMGPDCGTAIVNGIPLGFANVVRRGGIGIVGASGTGIQEVTSLIDRWGGGISQALGTGGRDLSEAVRGRSMLGGIDALAADPETRVLVIISKAPAPAVSERVLGSLERTGKPVVVHFVGTAAQPARGAMTFAETLEETARVACRLAGISMADDEGARPAKAHFSGQSNRGAGMLRGFFCGGTLAQEAWAVLRRRGVEVRSNVAADHAFRVPAKSEVRGHALWDLGDDVFTVGRPHPMIEPELRDAEVARALADSEVSVVLVDCVLGYGAHSDPAGSLAQAVTHADQTACVIASVTGTDRDPQGYREQRRKLEAAGVLVADSNAQAAECAVALLGVGARKAEK